eukprot:6492403-Amphidinium_carterae.4
MDHGPCLCFPPRAFKTPWQVFNGDWRSSRICHKCTGCCTSREDCVNKMVAACLSLDLLLGSDVVEPALDDWGSCGTTCAKVAAGIAVHGLLPKLLSKALSGMRAPLGPQAGEALSGAEFFRRRLRKKATKACVFLQSQEKRIRCLLVCWLAGPVERLMSKLTYLDEQRKGLFCAMQANLRNPFFECKVKLISLLCEPSLLQPVLDRLGDVDSNQVVKEARGLLLSFASQVYWRFLPYQHFPFKLISAIDVSLAEGERRKVVSELFSQQDCCKDAAFGQKLCTHVASVDELFENGHLMRMLQTFAYVHRFTNMQSERLLATIRRSSGEGSPLVERAVSIGLLSQVLSQHKQVGGDDPTCVTRRQLQGQGVPLRAKAKRVPTKASPFIHWVKEQQQEFGQQAHMSKAEYRSWQLQKGAEYRALPQAVKDVVPSAY